MPNDSALPGGLSHRGPRSRTGVPGIIARRRANAKDAELKERMAQMPHFNSQSDRGADHG